MNPKNLVMIIIGAITITASTVLLFFGRNIFPVAFVGALTFLIVFGTWSPPKKHKTFTYRDQQRAMRAFDRTELLDFELGSAKKKKGRKRS